MTSLAKWARKLFQRSSLPPLRFPTSGFRTISESEVLEEEHLDAFRQGQYYPVNIGDVYSNKYQVLGKLGFGTTSTVWLSRNLQNHEYVTLKVYTRDGGHRSEFEVYEKLKSANPSHQGYRSVRSALELFTVHCPEGNHTCLVQKPMWESLGHLLHRNPSHRFHEDLLRGALQYILLGLDYLHTECKLVHTDIKADNLLQEIVDTSILESFTSAEMEAPSPRKSTNSGHTVYKSRTFDLPRDFGGVVLSDFGSAVDGEKRRNHDAQPNVYRSPEVMLKADWSYPVDIWNVGVMIWDLFEDKHMFYGNDPTGIGYSTRAHLAEVAALLGPPPLDMIKRGVRSAEFFSEDGKWISDVHLPRSTSLEESEEYLEGTNKEEFLRFMRGMLQWRPEDRKTAAQLLEDPWLNKTL
ncbi:CMGC protein kinase [Aspergillus heterothallicus]